MPLLPGVYFSSELTCNNKYSMFALFFNQMDGTVHSQIAGDNRYFKRAMQVNLL